MPKLVLLRHGESQWNQDNRFTGWMDVDLSDLGRKEAQTAGQTLRQEGFIFDQVHTSILKRAIRTTWIVLDHMEQMYVPVQNSWRLNERHYGALQGLNKKETAQRYGDEQVFIWRRSYDVSPPALDDQQRKAQFLEHRFRFIPKEDIPSTESLLQCQKRVIPYWQNMLAPSLKKGQSILVVAHGNSLRSLIKFLDQIPDDKISELNIPTGKPIVYELDEATLSPIHHREL